MTIAPADLVRSPDHYLHSFERDMAVIVPMDRAAYHASIFLDGRIRPAGEGAMQVAPGVLGAVPAPHQIGWIFHLAHVGSTLLARALDHLDSNLVLREPFALRQMGIAFDPARFDLVLAMLGRRYDPALPTIVKANVPVNFILPALAERLPEARAILLHCCLRDWLLAVLRSPDHRRWVRGVAGQLAHHLDDLSALDDAECGAAFWLAQMRAFEAAQAAWPGAHALDAERFLAEPAAALRAAAAHLGVPMDEARIAATVAGSLFAHDAKRPGQPFDNERRLARRAELERTLAPELERAERWLERKGAAGISLGSPLI